MKIPHLPLVHKPKFSEVLQEDLQRFWQLVTVVALFSMTNSKQSNLHTVCSDPKHQGTKRFRRLSTYFKNNHLDTFFKLKFAVGI